MDLVDGTAMMGETGKEYSDLVMTINGGNPIPIAHGVRSIKLDTIETDTGEVDAEGEAILKSDLTNYLEADMVTVSVEMRNEKYGYTAYSGETYLRNRPGTGGNKINPLPPNNGAQLTVLRYHEYDLTKIVPSGYTHFKWSDSTDSTSTAYYTLNGNKLSCSGLNNQWDKDFDGEILASDKPDGSENQWDDPITISIHTDVVNSTPKIMLNSWDKSDACANYFPVYGICTCSSCVTSRNLEAQLTLDMPDGGFNKEIEEWWPTHQMVTKHVDLVTFKSSNNCDLEHEGGTAYAEYDELGDLDNVVFATGTTGEDGEYSITINPKLLVNYYSHKSGMSNAHGSASEINTNYEAAATDQTLIDQLGLTYTWGNDKDGQANAFTLTTYNACVEQGVNYYWNNIVDSGSGNGFIRVKLTAGYPGGKSFTAYGYIYPQLGGDAAQHNRVLNEIVATEATP